MRLSPTARLRLIISLVAFDVLVAIGVVIWVFTRPQPVELDDGRVETMARTLNRMETLFGQLACQRGLAVSSLAEVMADVPGYTLTEVQRKAVVDVFGEKNIPGAGILTYYMAYYRIRRGNYPYTEPTTPPGLNPTQPGVVLCQDTGNDMKVTLVSAAMQGERGIIEYDYGPYLREATLIQASGRWFVVGLVTKRISP